MRELPGRVGLPDRKGRVKNMSTEEQYEIVGFDLQQLIDSFPFYVLLIDEDHRILMGNKALAIPIENIIGQYCPQAIHGCDGPFPGCPLEEAVLKGIAVSRELFDEKTKRWLDSRIFPTPFRTKGGKKVYFHQVFDITERKTAQKQLEERTKELEEFHKAVVGRELKMIALENELAGHREAVTDFSVQQELFTSIADGIEDGVLLISKDFKILWANKAILRAYGCGLQDVVGKHCYEVTHNRKELCAPPNDICPILEVEQTGRPKTVRHTHFQDGKKFLVDVTAYPMFNHFGEISEYVHISHEVKGGS
jgi:PAS domain S-box-containing protein